MTTIGITLRSAERLDILRGHNSKMQYVSNLIDSAYMQKTQGESCLTELEHRKLDDAEVLLAQVSMQTADQEITTTIRAFLRKLAALRTPSLDKER